MIKYKRVEIEQWKREPLLRRLAKARALLKVYGLLTSQQAQQAQQAMDKLLDL